VLLLLEVIKGARPGAKYLTDHLLSLIVSGGAVAEFVLWPHFGTSTYFLLTMLALVDFLSGIALRARRGMQAASSVTDSRRSARTPAAAPEPPFEPAPAPSIPAAASVAEAVLLDHPPPKIVHPDVTPDVTPGGPSPEGPVPGIAAGRRLAVLAGHAAALTCSPK
jgi:hypothetical protein